MNRFRWWSHNSQRIQDGRRHSFWISKKRCTTASGGAHVSKKNSQKLIRVTSSNKHRKPKCIDRIWHLNEIWYRALAKRSKFTYRENPTRRRPKAVILNFENIGIFCLDKKDYTKFGGKMHHHHTEVTMLPKKNGKFIPVISRLSGANLHQSQSS